MVGWGRPLTEIYDALLVQIHTSQFMRQAAEVAVNGSALLHYVSIRHNLPLWPLDTVMY